MTIKKTILVASMLSLVAGMAFADEIKDGKKQFKKCKACHSVKAGKNKVGPSLANIVGRKAASIEDFKYSPAMTAKGEEGLVWTEENLDTFIKKPKKFIDKTSMGFAGLKKDKKRAALLAYLKSLSADADMKKEEEPKKAAK